MVSLTHKQPNILTCKSEGAQSVLEENSTLKMPNEGLAAYKVGRRVASTHTTAWALSS